MKGPRTVSGHVTAPVCGGWVTVCRFICDVIGWDTACEDTGGCIPRVGMASPNLCVPEVRTDNVEDKHVFRVNVRMYGHVRFGRVRFGRVRFGRVRFGRVRFECVTVTTGPTAGTMSPEGSFRGCQGTNPYMYMHFTASAQNTRKCLLTCCLKSLDVGLPCTMISMSSVREVLVSKLKQCVIFGSYKASSKSNVLLSSMSMARILVRSWPMCTLEFKAARPLVSPREFISVSSTDTLY
eukprot:2222138-Rhodomonas_salina.4